MENISDLNWLLWLLQVVLIPLVIWVFKSIMNVKGELNNLKVHIAENYAKNDAITRVENKIDELKDLILTNKIGR